MNCKALIYGTQDETRTHTPLLALPPQSSVSTNSTTWAFQLEVRT